MAPGTILIIIFVFWGFVALFIGFGLFANAPTPLYEIEACLLVLIATVAFGCAAIMHTIRRAATSANNRDVIKRKDRAKAPIAGGLTTSQYGIRHMNLLQSPSRTDSYHSRAKAD